MSPEYLAIAGGTSIFAFGRKAMAEKNPLGRLALFPPDTIG